MPRIIDLSIFLETVVITDPPFMRPQITCQTHDDTMPGSARWTRAVAIYDE